MEAVLREFDIIGELWREYEWCIVDAFDKDSAHREIHRIDNPITLILKEGSMFHRIVDSEGVVHLVPSPPYSILKWKNEGGLPRARF